MFYVIAEYLGFPGLLNLIRYISFRAGAATATALAIGLIIGPWFINMLRVRQGKGQPIRADGPQKLIEGMEAVVERGRLVIRPAKKGWFGGMQWSGDAAKVTITVPALTSAAVAGSGTIAIDGHELPAEGRKLAQLRSYVGMVFQSFNLFAHKTIL